MDNQTSQLLACVRSIINFDNPFADLGNIDVQWLHERLHWHKILPLASAIAVKETCQNEFLNDVFFRTTVQYMAQKNYYQQQVAQLFEIFSKNNINVIPYKGPFWGMQIYPDFNWRHIGDIDLLMNIEDARKTSAILQQLGYIPEILGNNEADDFKNRGELTFHPENDQSTLTSVQLHWQLMPAPRFLHREYIINDDFFDNTTDANWQGINYQLPSSEARFLYHILHATCQHQFNRLILVTDMAVFLKHGPQINWTTFFDLGKKRNCLTPIYYALKWLSHFTSIPSPATHFIDSYKPPLSVKLLCSSLNLDTILKANFQYGRTPRKLFRLAMS